MALSWQDALHQGLEGHNDQGNAAADHQGPRRITE